MRYAIRQRQDEALLGEVEVVEFEQSPADGEVVAIGYLKADLVSAPEPGANVITTVAFEGMGVER